MRIDHSFWCARTGVFCTRLTCYMFRKAPLHISGYSCVKRIVSAPKNVYVPHVHSVTKRLVSVPALFLYWCVLITCIAMYTYPMYASVYYDIGLLSAFRALCWPENPYHKAYKKCGQSYYDDYRHCTHTDLPMCMYPRTIKVQFRNLSKITPP
jgi:hypothetical protein